MPKLGQIRFHQAENIYSIANTPEFLMVRLKYDPLIRDISQTTKANEIFQLLKKSIKAKPTTIQAVIKPFILLVMLAHKGQTNMLSAATKLSAPYHKWFSSIAQMLVNNSQSYSIQQIPPMTYLEKSAVLPVNSSTLNSKFVKL